MAGLPQSWHAGNEAKRLTSCLERLAQLALLVCRLRSPLPTSRQCSDNVTAGAAVMKAFTTADPLRRLEKVSTRWATISRVKLVVDYLPGDRERVGRRARSQQGFHQWCLSVGVAERLATTKGRYLMLEWYPFYQVYVHESEMAALVPLLSSVSGAPVATTERAELLGITADNLVVDCRRGNFRRGRGARRTEIREVAAVTTNLQKNEGVALGAQMCCWATNFSLMLGWTQLLPFGGKLHVMFVKIMSKRYFFFVLFGTIWGSIHLPCHSSDARQDDLWTLLNEMEETIINFRRRHLGATGTRIHPNANSAPFRWWQAVSDEMCSLRLRARRLSGKTTIQLRALSGITRAAGRIVTPMAAVSFTLITCSYLEKCKELPVWFAVVLTWAVIIGLLMLSSGLRPKSLGGAVSHDEFSQQGSAARIDTAKQQFMKGVADDLCWRQGVSKGKAPAMVEEVIYSHAVGIEQCCSTTVE